MCIVYFFTNRPAIVSLKGKAPQMRLAGDLIRWGAGPRSLRGPKERPLLEPPASVLLCGASNYSKLKTSLAINLRRRE